MTGRESFARYRELMEARGFRPSRRLGQNFLLDPSLHRLLVDTAGIRPEDCVLEVGAGLGFLTRQLAARAARVVAAEIDSRLMEILRDERPGFVRGGEHVDLVHGDVLDRGVLREGLATAVEQARRQVPGRLLIASNLPYAIAGPLLATLTTGRDPPAGGAVLVQLEMAERLTAGPGTRAYGTLSVVLQSVYEMRLVRRVGREVFRPRPAVDSGIVELRGRPDGGTLAPDERAGFARMVRALFSMRRKKLRSALGAFCPAGSGELGAAVPPALADRRPDALTGAELVEIWRVARGFV